MSDEFDPYYAWLGIPPKDQPPNHYRLLGVELFETNLDVIESAAFRQMGHVRTYQSGKHSQESQKLLNELSAAKINLLDPDKKQAYDELLRATIDSIAAFLPDDMLDTPTPAATPKSEAESVHVLDFEIGTSPSDSAARSAVSAIRRRKPKPTSRTPLIAGVIIAVVGVGALAMFGSNPTDVVISPNEQLVAGCVSNQVMIWELATGKMLSRTTAVNYTGQLAFSPDNRRILCAGLMHELSVINAEDGAVVQTLRGQTRGSVSTARTVAYLPDPRGAVSAGYDGVIRVWRLPD